MGKKNDKSKATESSKAARKALKEGLAKPAVEASPHAVEGEKAEWGVQLDELRAHDFQTSGMTEKVAKVLRNQRVKQLKKGKELQEPEVVEPVIASDTEADEDGPEFTYDEGEDQVTEPVAHILEVGSNDAADQDDSSYLKADEEPDDDYKRYGYSSDLLAAARKAVGNKKASKKFRNTWGDGATPEAILKSVASTDKVLAKADAKKAKSDSDFHPLIEEVREVLDRPSDHERAQPYDGGVEVAPSSFPSDVEKPTRRDNSLIALQQAQVRADEAGKKQKVVMPRKYKSKNYGVKLISQYTAKDPSLNLAYKGDDMFNEDTGDFSVTLIVQPKK